MAKITMADGTVMESKKDKESKEKEVDVILKLKELEERIEELESK